MISDFHISADELRRLVTYKRFGFHSYLTEGKSDHFKELIKLWSRGTNVKPHVLDIRCPLNIMTFRRDPDQTLAQVLTLTAQHRIRDHYDDLSQLDPWNFPPRHLDPGGNPFLTYMLHRAYLFHYSTQGDPADQVVFYEP